jgi:hypothetical protein
MTDLSPAAQAVDHAAFTLADLLNRDVSESEMIAAALRALADHQRQFRLTLDAPLDHWDPDPRTRQELRNIAAELAPEP